MTEPFRPQIRTQADLEAAWRHLIHPLGFHRRSVWLLLVDGGGYPTPVVTEVVDLPEEPVEVTGDAPRLHQVVMNLLANARVHTPEGTKVVASLAVDPAAQEAVVTVSDDGPGIPQELQSTLFERFARGDSSRNRATGSTGLGLAIVLAVVEAHGGTVAVTSEPGSTVFTVRLPLASAERGAPAAPAAVALQGTDPE